MAIKFDVNRKRCGKKNGSSLASVLLERLWQVFSEGWLILGEFGCFWKRKPLRIQFVKSKKLCRVGESTTLAFPVTFGVPQGSILGPLLFLVYVIELPAAIEHSEVSLYASDTVLYWFAKEPRELENKFNADLYNIAMSVAKSEQTYLEPFIDQMHFNRKQ